MPILFYGTIILQQAEVKDSYRFLRSSVDNSIRLVILLDC
ncbi:unnamed protein product [Prunus brigantina]